MANISTYSPTPTPNDEIPLSEKDKNDAIKFAQQISDENTRLFKRAIRITEAGNNEQRAINELLRLWSEDGGDIRYVNGQATIYPSNVRQRQRVMDELPAYGDTARVDNQGSFTRNGIRHTRVAVQLGGNTYAQVLVPLNPETSDVNSNYYPISYRRIRGGLLNSQRRREQGVIVPHPESPEIPPPGSPAIEGFLWIIVFGLIAVLSL